MDLGDAKKLSHAEATVYTDRLYGQVAERWQARVTNRPFMQMLRSGNLSRDTLRLFFRNWASFTIDINTLECATYHKHIAFFRKHRDLMTAMARKLADELIYPKPPRHIHVVLETARALGISEDEVFLEPIGAEFRSLIDFRRALLWEGTMAEVYAAGSTEQQIGYWSAECFKAVTAHYGLTPEQAAYFSTHEEADLKEHQGGVIGHGSFRRMVLERLLEEGAETRPGYSLEYCANTSVDLYGAMFQAALQNS
jgi:pyrroloquinoline quinone (PQQ) biosynthesis protein C